MGKLSGLKPILSALRPKVAYAEDPSSRRISAPAAWKEWYHTHRWRQLRMACLVRDLFTCQNPACRKMIGDTSKLVADHKIPHRGRRELFFDIDNLQTLCAPCHASLKQKEEQATPPGVWD